MQEMLNLKWDSFSSQLTNSLDVCYEKQFFVDLSLVCKNGTILKCHKMILANASSFFRRLLVRNDHPHPMIILHDIEADDLKTIINFMYCGEIHVVKSEVRRILKVAEILEVSGLKDIRCKLLIPENNVGRDGSDKTANTENTSKNQDSKSPGRSNVDDEVAAASTSSFETRIPSVARSSCNFSERVNKSGRGSEMHAKSRANSMARKYESNCSGTAGTAPEQTTPNCHRFVDSTKSPGGSGSFSKKRLFRDEPISWSKVLSEISKGDGLPLKRLCVMDEVEITASGSMSELPPGGSGDDFAPSSAVSEVDPLDTTGVYIKEEIDADTDDQYYDSHMTMMETDENPTLRTIFGAKSIEVFRNVRPLSPQSMSMEAHGSKDSGA